MALTDNLAITEVAPNQDQKETTINNALNRLDNATQGALAISFTANARTLTADEFTNNLDFQLGTLTATGTLTIPNTKRLFSVDNRNSGESCVVTNGSGSTVSVPSGVLSIIRNNGTDVIAPSALATSAGVSTAVGSGEIVVSPTVGAVTVSLGTIASGHLLANGGTVSAAPGDTTLTALLDVNFGMVANSVLQRNGSVWVETTVVSGITLSADVISGGTFAGAITNAGTISGGTLGGTITNAGIITGGSITGLPTPSASSDAVPKSYVDLAIQGLTPKPTAQFATTGTLAANAYANGASGVGATLTGNSNGALAMDGGSPSIGQKVLVKNEATGANNGLYDVTQAGDGSHPYILTRDVDMDQTGGFVGGFLVVEQGTVNAGSLWLCTNTSAPTVGTTTITFVEMNKAADLVQGNLISFNANTIGVANIPNGDLIGNIAGSSAPATTISATAFLDSVFGNSQGAILYRGSSAWGVLNPGTLGYVLTTGGASANPSWSAAGNIWNGPTVTTVGDGLGTNSGTIQADHQSSGNISGTTTITPSSGISSYLGTIGANSTISIANGNYAGQHFRLEILQDTTGTRTVAFDSSVAFGSDITSFTATATPSKRDLLQLVWSAAASKWLLVAVAHGF